MRRVLTTDWHWQRIFRTVTGLASLVYAVIQRDNLLGIGGAMLLLMGVTNTGCGAAGGCATPVSRNVKPDEPVVFEEVK